MEQKLAITILTSTSQEIQFTIYTRNPVEKNSQTSVGLLASDSVKAPVESQAM